MVSKNDEENALENQYRVHRYWQDSFSNWVESEHLFDLSDGPYDNVFVFDKHAIVTKNRNVVKIAWFESFK